MEKDNFPVGDVRVKIRAIEATNSYRLYATVGDTTPVPLDYVDKATANAHPQGPESFCRGEAATYIREVLRKCAAETGDAP